MKCRYARSQSPAAVRRGLSGCSAQLPAEQGTKERHIEVGGAAVFCRRFGTRAEEEARSTCRLLHGRAGGTTVLTAGGYHCARQGSGDYRRGSSTGRGQPVAAFSLMTLTFSNEAAGTPKTTMTWINVPPGD